MTTYAVKEIFYSLQGEGAQSGRPAIFLRFAGCNLWSGREDDRAEAVCQFCDTDFIGVNGEGGGKFASVDRLAEAVDRFWPKGEARKYVICTGGEPLLQLDAALVDALHGKGYEIAIETNGTIAAPAGVDWVCVSPKAGAPLVQKTGDELKLVYHQPDAPPEEFEDLAFDFFYLQPMDGPSRDAHTQAAIAYCKRHPQWRLSLQNHKTIGIR